MSRSVFSEPYEFLLQALIEGRRAAELRQVDLAERIGKPQSFVSKFETGERRLDVVEFLVIAKAIGMDAQELIGSVSTMIKPSTRI